MANYKNTYKLFLIIIALLGQNKLVAAPGQPWTTKEKEKLTELINGLVDKRNIQWSELASSIGGRTGKQAREHWCNVLDPDTNRTPLTEEELHTLHDLACSGLYIKDSKIAWSRMVIDHFPDRTDSFLKNSFYSRFRLTWKVPLKEESRKRKSETKAQAQPEQKSARQNCPSLICTEAWEFSDSDSDNLPEMESPKSIAAGDLDDAQCLGRFLLEFESCQSPRWPEAQDWEASAKGHCRDL